MVQVIQAGNTVTIKADDGDSAYQDAVDQGFVGTLDEWLASLKSTTPGPQGNPGGNVMAIGLRTGLTALTIPVGVGRIATSGFREEGKGASDLFRWSAPMAALPAAGQGYWWDYSADGAQWFINRGQVTPEMLGAYGDDGVYASTSALHGTDDGLVLQQCLDYCDRTTLLSKYYSSICLNFNRPVSMRGCAGFGASLYFARIRWPRGLGANIMMHRGDTFANAAGVPSFGTNPFGGATGFDFGNVELVSGQGNYIAYDGTNLIEHGLWPKTRGTISGILAQGMMGNGIHGLATANSTDPLRRGNLNDITIEFVRFVNITGHGLFLDGADCNSGRIRGINAANIGGAAIYASEFLGNTYDSPSAAATGLAGRAVYGGYLWWCLNEAQAGIDAPGTNDTWARGPVSAAADDWAPGKAYLFGLNYRFEDDNAAIVVNNAYVENGGPVFAGKGTVLLAGAYGGWNEGGGWFGPGCRLQGSALTFNKSYLGVAAGQLKEDYLLRSFAAASWEFGRTHNRSSGGSRDSYHTFCSGYMADGVTPRMIGRTGFLSGTGAHTYRIGVYEVTGVTLTQVLGVTAVAVRPEVDNTITNGTAALRFSQAYAANFRPGAGTATWTAVAGTPEAVVTATVGSLLTQTDGAAGSQVWTKGSGTGNTGWQRLPTYLSGTATYDAPSIAAAGTTTTNVTVTGAALGDVVNASFNISMGGLMMSAEVSAANTVRVTLFNPTASAIDLASATVKAVVFKAG